MLDELLVLLLLWLLLELLLLDELDEGYIVRAGSKAGQALFEYAPLAEVMGRAGLWTGQDVAQGPAARQLHTGDGLGERADGLDLARVQHTPGLRLDHFWTDEPATHPA